MSLQANPLQHAPNQSANPLSSAPSYSSMFGNLSLPQGFGGMAATGVVAAIAMEAASETAKRIAEEARIAAENAKKKEEEQQKALLADKRPGGGVLNAEKANIIKGTEGLASPDATVA